MAADSDENLPEFTEIDEDGIALRTIVAEQEYIDTGVLGDPANWIEGHTRVGNTYDKVRKKFIGPRPFPGWTLDADKEWQPPIAKPDDGEEYYWNWVKTKWTNVSTAPEDD